MGMCVCSWAVRAVLTPNTLTHTHTCKTTHTKKALESAIVESMKPWRPDLVLDARYDAETDEARMHAAFVHVSDGRSHIDIRSHTHIHTHPHTGAAAVVPRRAGAAGNKHHTTSAKATNGFVERGGDGGGNTERGESKMRAAVERGSEAADRIVWGLDCVFLFPIVCVGQYDPSINPKSSLDGTGEGKGRRKGMAVR